MGTHKPRRRDSCAMYVVQGWSYFFHFIRNKCLLAVLCKREASFTKILTGVAAVSLIIHLQTGDSTFVAIKHYTFRRNERN